MKKAFLFILILFAINSFAQDESVKKMQSESSRTIKKDPADTVPSIWKKGGIYKLTCPRAL
jgi:hypothetical protein